MRRAVLIAFAIVLTLLVFHRLAFTGLIFGRGDTFSYFYPYWSARDAALANFQLPLWTPDIFMGAPLLANPQLGTFYPLNWLTIPLTAPDAIRISVLLHVTLAIWGAALMARRVLAVAIIPAMIAGAIYGVGGVVGAHVEQINQLQGLAWLPWALLAFYLAQAKPFRYIPVLGVVMALQFLSGHTQTSFITAVALGVLALLQAIRNARDLTRGQMAIGQPFAVLLGAALLAVVLTLPQLIPTLELSGQSVRGGGLNPQEAMAFSWNPFLIGRGLLPSYESQVFGEYVAYVGVIGLALALYGAFKSDARRWPWLVLAIVGLVLALGLSNPLYWLLANLPGFNWFRVPARWLALFAISAAMLAALGMEWLTTRERTPVNWTARRALLSSTTVVLVLLGVVVGASFLSDRAASEVNGSALPTAITLVGWAAALFGLVNLLLLRRYAAPGLLTGLVALLVIGELFAASLNMPYNDLVDPAAFSDPRFTRYQLDTDHEASCDSETCPPPGRLLSISPLLFDTGDKAVLDSRYNRLGMTERAVRYGLVATKLQETLSPNLPLVYGLPSVDGFGGGVLPTESYSQFSALLLPDGSPRTQDGRLRETLADPACNGACLPDRRWLNLTNTRYLILDKTFDRSIEGVRYDTAFTVSLAADERHTITHPPDFVATELRLLYRGDDPPIVTVNTNTLRYLDFVMLEDGLLLARYQFDDPTAPASMRLDAVSAAAVIAMTLVDTRTGDFDTVTLDGWDWRLSSDIKLYENRDVLPRAFVVYDALTVADSWQGNEDALSLMSDPAFDPARQIVVAGGDALTSDGDSTATVTRYTATEVAISVTSDQPGYLLLTDAYDPNWVATVNDTPSTLHRANVMFRAVRVEAGESVVLMRYAPWWLPVLPVVGLVAWLVLIAGFARFWRFDD